MIKTKIFKQKGSSYWRLLVKKNGKYKVQFKSTSKKKILKERKTIRHEAEKTYVGVKICDLDYHKLQVVSKTLKHKTFNKTMSELITKAHADCAKQSTF